MRVKNEEKRTQLLKAAIKLFAEKGFEQTRITEIAEMAGMAPGSVYTYFENKEDLLFQMIASLWNDLSSAIEAISKNSNLDPLQKVQAMVDQAFETFTANPNLGLVVIFEHNQLRKKGLDASSAEYEHILKSFQRVFKEGTENGFFDPVIDPDTFLHFTFGGLYHLIHRWANAPRLYDIPQIKEQIKYFVQQSLIRG